MSPTQKILNLAKIYLTGSVQTLLNVHLGLTANSKYSYVELARGKKIVPERLLRLLNFAAFAKLISWEDQSNFIYHTFPEEESVDALGLMKYLVSSEKIEVLSGSTIKQALHQELLAKESNLVTPHKDMESVLNLNSSDCMVSWIQNYISISSELFRPEFLYDSLKTGRTQWSNAFGLDVESPFDLEKFDLDLFENLMKAMHQSNVSEAEVLCPKLEISGLQKILDIGGASGALGNEVCSQFPSIISYSIYELESAIPIYERIRSKLKDKEKCVDYRPGNFFHNTTIDTLSGLNKMEKFNAIILGWILHDWNDEDALVILRKAKSHLENDGVLILLEAVFPENRLGPVTILDLTMMVQTGGKERTLSEYKILLEKAGLKLQKITPTDGRRQILYAEVL